MNFSCFFCDNCLLKKQILASKAEKIRKEAAGKSIMADAQRSWMKSRNGIFSAQKNVFF